MSEEENFFSRYKAGQLSTRSFYRKLYSNWIDFKDKGLSVDSTFTDTVPNTLDTANTGVAVANRIHKIANNIMNWLSGMGGQVAGYLTFFLIGYNVYSNRDKKHQHMSKYLPSLVDKEEPPEKNFYKLLKENEGDAKIIKEVCGDALYLLKEGLNQYQRMHSKLYNDHMNFWKFYSKIKDDVEKLNANNEKEYWEQLKKIQHELLKEMKENGKIHNYIRRLIHTGNYLQCGSILNHAILTKLNDKKYDDAYMLKYDQNKDPFEDVDWVRVIREGLKAAGNLFYLIKSANLKMDAAELDKVETDYKFFSEYKNNLLGISKWYTGTYHSFIGWKKKGISTESPIYGINNAANVIIAIKQSLSLLHKVAQKSAWITGQALGLGMGFGGLLLMAYEKYSNNEAVHNKMAQYLPSLVDGHLPNNNFYTTDDETVINEVFGCALNLLKDGINQYQRIPDKLHIAHVKFWMFMIEILNELAQEIEKASKEKTFSQVAAEIKKGPSEARATIVLGDSPNEYLKKNPQVVYLLPYDKIKDLNNKLKKETKENGVIFEYIRRLVHTGNYLQCGAILNHGIMRKLDKKKFEVVDANDRKIEWKVDKDPFEDVEWVKEIREKLEEVGKTFDVIESTYGPIYFNI